MRGGLNTFTWKYTAAHATSKWHYSITKNKVGMSGLILSLFVLHF
ncbi:hypothetical protein F0342_00375 [Bacillus sp. CH30_1T]|nr:hypothetical protein F0342_00375 [Bacillus sp. CH30_1T]